MKRCDAPIALIAMLLMVKLESEATETNVIERSQALCGASVKLS